MFGLTTATRVFAAPGATDMRKGFNGLHGLVRDALGEDPLSGHLFLFANRDRTRIKILVFDGSGLWVCSKRLEKGRFRWPDFIRSSNPLIWSRSRRIVRRKTSSVS